MKKNLLFLILSTVGLSAALFPFPAKAQEQAILAIGAGAPDFKLKGVDNKTYTLASFSDKKILVVIFTCNHCPTAQAYEDRIIKLHENYKNKGVAVVAISPNDPKSITLNELGYSDLSDSFEEMKIRAKEKQFLFPYLYDGDSQEISRAYGPVATPHVFIFDANRKLRYQGRIDDVENPAKTPNNFNTIDAIESLLAGKAVAVPTTRVFGCSVKWTEKNSYQEKLAAEWAKEPVTLEQIDAEGVKNLLKNNSDKLRLINVWATWCGPCIKEFPDFITINRMFRGRDFEFISISADEEHRQEKALKFLKDKQASNKNYIFNGPDKYELMDAIDKKWAGGLPYTIIVEPGGKIVYAKQGIINPQQIKRTIVDHPLIGRFY
ncbi:MAG: redoxin domain-containing protein [Chitinophagaceae bacterium]|nr:redoxin domain-containing protein [Chitinophagaceae bacterium]MCW5925974.1 redoxin domain-containing protein [Chitinophagaceae bacterium]